MEKTKKHRKRFSSDRAMKMTWIHLLEDFGLNYGNFTDLRSSVLSGDIATYRDIPYPGFSNAPVDTFKRCYQLQSLFKRYRFKGDKYTQTQLETLTVEKLLGCQIRISDCEQYDSHRLFPVLQLARSICKRILGRFDAAVHANLCRFAKRATFGNSLSDSYLDQKLSVLTGSRDHIGWFHDHLLSDELLGRSLVECSKKEPYYEVCDTLSLTNVPKSFKALRSIMPNTTLGSFYTAGLGDYISDRLKSNGLNIRTLQERHKVLAKRFSETRSHVTADLSSASDSITFALLNRIIPRDWMTALNKGRIRHFHHENEHGLNRLYMHSFMTMGIGFTFPLETLVFYSILESIRRLTKSPGFVSVYGDDLIYHRKMHPVVLGVFSLLRFQVNEDKTFVESFFRESCGGDYYHGTDVRPFQPEGDASGMSKPQYMMFIYKMINGLLQRWKKEEIPSTYEYLTSILLAEDHFVCYVPEFYSSDAGIRVSSPPCALTGSQVLWSESKMAWEFPFYKKVVGDRPVLCLTPYYWECLRSGHTDRIPSIYDVDVDTVIWLKSKPKRFIRSKLTGQRLRRLVAHVKSKDHSRLVRQTGATSQWT
jgi:hypothetical protein